MVIKDPSPCYFCGKPIHRVLRLYCWGCSSVICNDCEVDPNNPPQGEHWPEAHNLLVCE